MTDTGSIDRFETLRPATGDPGRVEAFIPTVCVQNHAGFILPRFFGFPSRQDFPESRTPPP